MSQCLLISLSFTWRVLSSQEPKNQKIDLSRGYGGLAHASGVAAAHAEAVGFTLLQVKQGEAGRLHRHAGVHSLPGVRP